MKSYSPTKSTVSITSGVISSISDDRKTVEVNTRGKNDDNQLVPMTFTAMSRDALDQSYQVGSRITMMTKIISDMDTFEDRNAILKISTDAASQEFSFKDLSMLSGYVKFARYVDEKNPDGTPKMTKEFTSSDGKTVPAHAKKPHFDISIDVITPSEDGQSSKHVLHTVRCYDFERKGKAPEKSQIEMLRKNFSDNYNFKTADKAIFATIATTPGKDGSYQKVVDDKEYTNYTCTHMGIKSIDIEFEKVKEKEQPSQSAPAQEVATATYEIPAQTATPSFQPTGTGLTADMEDSADMFKE